MKNLVLLILILLVSLTVFPQDKYNDVKLRLNNYESKSGINDPLFRKINVGNSFRLGTLILVSVLNPIVVYENKKIYIGTTRELTLGFGKYTRYRVSIEYSFLFRSFLKHHFRASAKYDIQLYRSRGEWFDDQIVVSPGAGYFVDNEGSGIFPELTMGFKIGEGLLFFPYAKIRHTFMFQKEKHDITDFRSEQFWGIVCFNKSGFVFFN